MKDKIYIFTNGVSRKNGGSSSILDLANNLIELDYKVDIITPFGFLDKYIYKPTNVNKKLNSKIVNEDIFCCLEKKPSSKKLLVNKLLNIFCVTNKNIKDSIIIDAIALPYSYLKQLQLNGCKVILNHAGSPNAYIKYFGMDGDKRSNLSNAREEYLNMIKHYDYILFQSVTQANTLTKLAKFKTNKTIVLTPGVSEDDISNISTKSILNENDFNITIVGSIQQRKGQHLVLDIAKKLKNSIVNIKFHIVGNIVDNNYYKSIKMDISKNKLADIVYLHGFKINYLEYMNSSDIIIQLSEEEGVSRILREAMALSKPIVSFALDGTNDLLENGNDSLLSEYGNIEEIINNILLLNQDKKIYNQLSINTLNNFKNKYSKNKYLKKLQNILNEIKDNR